MKEADMEDTPTGTEAYRRSRRLAEDMVRARAAYFKAAPVDQDRRKDDGDDDPAMRARFEDWVKQQGRVYRDEEEARRFAIFRSVARFVDAANADAIQAGHDTRFGLNDFSDWNEKEIYGLGGALPSDDEHLCMIKPYLVKQGIWHKIVADRKAAGEVIPDCGGGMKQILQSCMRGLQKLQKQESEDGKESPSYLRWWRTGDKPK